MLKVIKNDGRIVDFNRNNIVFSIKRAANSAESDVSLWDSMIKCIADSIEETCNRSLTPVSTKIIRNIVEDKLMSFFAYDVVRSYIGYGYEKKYFKSMISAY